MKCELVEGGYSEDGMKVNLGLKLSGTYILSTKLWFQTTSRG